MRNGKTRISERTNLGATGSSGAATYVYDEAHDTFQQVASAYWDMGSSTTRVDFAIEGVDGILRHLMDTGEHSSTTRAHILGE